ncbi:MAG TPA: copper homeostasis protein CutC [Candidatus Sulfotelmatobacter sp.]|nr:copper homeostasis protein CutC [Candidatus Sulfotelmatobacter sp.]
MTEPLLIEVCVDSVASALAAQRGGAHRVELCSALLEGGVTPSLGLLEMVRSRISIPLHPIIRPRGGDFCYSEEEFQIMGRDVEIAKHAGADGVALGILDRSGRVDIRRTRELVELAGPLPVTFHRAFDMCADLQASLDEICETGAARILTSGGEPDALRGVEKIAELVKWERIKIMAGGRITARNVAQILEGTGVSEIHVGLASAVESPMVYRNPRVSLGKVQGQEYQHTQVLEERVRELKLAAARARRQLS